MYPKDTKMRTIKRTNVAGIFYPSDEKKLNRLLEKLILPFNKFDEFNLQNLKVLVAPHAGYAYSGAVAGAGYFALSRSLDTLEKIAILSPSHYFNLHQIAFLNYDEYSTPTGSLKIDKRFIKSLTDKTMGENIPEVFENEHALEVQLPFIKKLYPDAEIIPVIVGQANPEIVQSLIDDLIQNNVFIVISSDLSHFHSYDEAKSIDLTTQRIIKTMDYEQLTGKMACGVYPLCGALKWAKENRASVKTLALQNSGDTAGSKDRVVGYGAFAICLP